jgi:hypothetical protein
MSAAGDFGKGANVSNRQRDFVLLTIFVLAQHKYLDRAAILAEALFIMGESSCEVMLARAVLRFLKGDWLSALTCLEEVDRLDPIERFGQYKLTESQRMRRFIKARCLHEIGPPGRAKVAIEAYLRHGTSDRTNHE